MTWRARQAEATRQAIVDSFRELSARPGARPVTMAAVARASGISSATIYRHFEDRAALVHAAATDDLHAAVVGELDQWGVAELRQHLRDLWSRFEANVPLIREGTMSEAGREMRRARFEAQQDELRAGLWAAGVDPEGDAARRYLAVVNLLGGSYAFLDLHERQELDAREAADTVAWALTALAAAVGADPTRIWVTVEDEREETL
jgi:AcrR family transcriptional regulator